MPEVFSTNKQYEGMQVTEKTEDEVLDWLQMEYRKHETDNYFLYVALDGNVSISGMYGQYIFKSEDGGIFLVDDPNMEFEKKEEDNG
jgi:hypothetical protein